MNVFRSCFNMTKLDEIKETIKKNKSLVQKEFGVKKIGIFGSYVKNTQKKRSDLDILVDFSRTISLLKFVKLENYLKDLLKIKVDLVFAGSLRPELRETILNEVIFI